METVAGRLAFAAAKVLVVGMATVVVTYGIPATVSAIRVTSNYVKTKISDEKIVRKAMKNLDLELEYFVG